MAEQRAFVWDVDADRARKFLDRMGDLDNDWDFEGMVTAKEVVASSVCGKLRELYIHEEGGEAFPISVNKFNELVLNGIDAGNENATMAQRSTCVYANLE